jgi:hypothetical protein
VFATLGCPTAERNRHPWKIYNILYVRNKTIIRYVSYKIDGMDIEDHLRNHGSAFNTEYVLLGEFLRDAKIT